MPGTNHNHPAAEYAYPAADVHDWIIRRADPAEKLVFLTFDDGPSELTGEMLDVLAAHEVPATFFVVGRQAGDRAATLHRQIREGHAIGLHSYSHDYDRLYPDRSADPERIREEIRDSKAAIAEVFGDDFRTGAWRHPGGRGSWDNMAAADEVLAEEDLTGVDWNALTGDSEPRSTRPESTSEMVSRATLPISWDAPAVVILAHDTRNARLTLESMPEIISAYRDAGYRFAVIA